MMETIHNLDTVVGAVETKPTAFGSKRYILKTDDVKPIKFYFFDLKKDGGETKPFQSYQQLGITIGSKVRLGYKETPKTFTDARGKEVDYMDRQILTIEKIS